MEDVDVANVVYTIREGADSVAPTLEKKDTDKDDDGSEGLVHLEAGVFVALRVFETLI